MMDAPKGDLVREDFVMREACRRCGPDAMRARVFKVGVQHVARCARCNYAVYNPPLVELGLEPRTCATVHAGVRPKRRSRILDRACRRCEKCGRCEPDVELHVGHMISVDVGLRFGLTEIELNDDENLLALCAECNLGMGNEPISFPLALAMLRARISFARNVEKRRT